MNLRDRLNNMSDYSGRIKYEEVIGKLESVTQDEVIEHFKANMAIEYGYREGLDYVVEIREAY